MSEQSTEEQMRDLAAAVIEALTVPSAKRPSDEHRAASLMRSRAAIVRGAMGCVADGSIEVRFAASSIRSGIVACPVVYEPFVYEGIESSSLGVASMPAAWSAAAVSA